MRGVFIAVGAAALHAFAFTFVIFGAILIWTGWKLFQHWDEDPDTEDNRMVKFVRARMNVTDEYHGEKMFVHIDGKRFATPLFLVMIAVASTDLLFALDSIPAILAITTDPFIVITSNIFAILGLRSLYFLLAGVMEKFYYLKPGLIAILLFIGIKMLVAEFIKIPTFVSLGVVMGILGIALLFSFLRAKKHPE
mgnify:CR=1 FL=1